MGIGPAPSQRGKERTAHDFTLPPLLGAEVLRPHAGLGRARGLPGVQSGLPVGRGGHGSLWRGQQGARDPGGTPVPRETRQTMTCKEGSGMKLLRLLLVAMLGVASLPPRATAAQAQAPTPLVITAHNVTAATAPARDNSAVARPGDVIRYTLVLDRKSTRLNSSHSQISYAVFCLKKKKKPYFATKFGPSCAARTRRNSPTATLSWSPSRLLSRIVSTISGGGLPYLLGSSVLRDSVQAPQH